MAYVLTETAAGYALLKAADKKIHKSSSLVEDLNTAEKVAEQFKIHRFEKFQSAANALEEANAIIEGKVSENLQKLLEDAKSDKKATLIVSEAKLGNAINKLGLNFQVVSDAASLDLQRAIKQFLPELLPGLDDSALKQMSLGLAHSMGRHKLKFSADKVDTMIIQAIALLDDLDKELNTYAMRCKEWYGWHFPELAKMITDSAAYARIILTMGVRSNASETDLSEILPEEVEEQVKAAAEVSMGTEITEDDLNNIKALAEQIVDFAAYREQLSNYLSSRMKAIAPNLTAMVGELVGARLIAHAGSLTSLAKAPASTVQILGAEKALFRALKTKHDTPKYGIIYHASLVGQASGKNKGRIARTLAAKAAVSLRYDCFDEERDESDDFGLENRAKVEGRLSQLEGRDMRTTSKVVREQPKVEITEARAYNADADSTAAAAAAAPTADSDDEESETEEVEEKKSKKDKKKDKKEKKDKKKDKKRKRDDDKEDKESSKKSKKDKKEKKEKKEKKAKKEKK
ncbi:nucleolar protein 58 [Candida albicans L26]|uniref:Nucleolar protein 58 n=3 Tax=Candida albicans TaxID=5476 RepID=NOP58_CANAL|nr:RNA-processing protein [Candida albicans SC5314]Q59S06.2 RecName: Full=Nucleolar protein 58 [Candida albicans SC5314]KAF6071062.1 Nucleolar protein 58 [Candida albicans]KGQ85919.1 nucleolar protein 58 [Candida albicans P37005]KGR07261.1 nucleolar protein 58 [Candida albicans P78048]KGR10885.1 nucleolar protein 58 [Candida albicans P37037]KGT65910.1 nucleolar protein 58 [Candida albicans 12C]KGU05335.1 nucleolar protein 58 [Candida albicans 19F]KGU05807.1 nucleolar protein 58 [Candida alb|eukprot:XP_712316.1 RNA-processing protein [Candida albicans SC5314]